MLWWDPVVVSTPLLTLIAGAHYFCVQLSPIYTKSVQGCLWVFPAGYEAAQVRVSDILSSRVRLGSWDHVHFQWCFSKDRRIQLCWCPFLFLHCQKWECFYKWLTISIECVHHWTPAIHTIMYDWGNGLGCSKCNGLAVSLKNTLFTDALQYDNEKLVNAVLKTLWIY